MILKKGNITLVQLVLLIVAVIMIILISGFGAKIAGVFISSGDKSTLSSFNTMYLVMLSQSKSQRDYEMSPVTLYLSDDYCMIYFYKQTIENNGDEYYRPQECSGKSCLCLYDDDPKYGQNDREDNVLECKSFDTPLKVDPNYFDIKGVLCSKQASRYKSYLVIKKTDENNQAYSYIINNNETNMKLHADWNVSICENTASECDGKKAGFIKQGKDDASVTKIYDYCSNLATAYKSTGIECKYDAAKLICNPDCSYGSIQTDPKKAYKSCNDYNTVPGILKHLDQSTAASYSSYYMCAHDDKFYNLRCAPQSLSIYPLKASFDGSLDINSISADKSLSACKFEYIDILSGKYLKSYDTTNEDCVKYVEQNFYAKNSIMQCTQGPSCISKIQSMSGAGTFKYIGSGEIYWITYYGNAPAVTADSLTYSPVDYCASKPATSQSGQ